jgi:hypothetical protein
MDPQAENTDHDMNPIPRDICPRFMTKTMTLNPEHRRSPEEDRSQSCTAHFWCVRTMEVFGPDDQDVFPDDCRPGRSCYEGVDPT